MLRITTHPVDRHLWRVFVPNPYDPFYISVLHTGDLFQCLRYAKENPPMTDTQTNLKPYGAAIDKALHDNLNGAVLVAAVQTESFADDVWFIVAWRNERERGTHRLCFGPEDKALLIWGHYFGVNEAQKQYTDLARRVGTALGG